VIGEYNRRMGRRELLSGSLLGGSVMLSGFDRLRWPEFIPTQNADAFRGGTLLGVVEFSDEGKAPLDQAIGSELDGRLFTDLSKLRPEISVIPTSSFYIRTRASKLLDTSKPWSIQLEGLVEKPLTLAVHDLEKMRQPMGLHLMECAGNSRSAHFGMLSVADWEGVPLEEILENMKPAPRATRVLVSGFDQYAGESRSSVAGASWIFTSEQLKTSRAFLATRMNGQSLTADHGAPVRLMVPGWYGCACIKWVNEIALMEEEAAATSQMQEYAGRTMQNGVPALAKEYLPALMDVAAMPVRVEKWRVGGKIKYRIAGIQWGGTRPIEDLEIRFNREEEYVPVESFQAAGGDSWNFWSLEWTPQKPGRYLIQVRLKGSSNVTRRLDSGYYLRSVEITEI
jgi:DMSO/TMAO reductase YedYZ molybdopterin-dependent catalytic subunit